MPFITPLFLFYFSLRRCYFDFHIMPDSTPLMPRYLLLFRCHAAATLPLFHACSTRPMMSRDVFDAMTRDV